MLLLYIKQLDKVSKLYVLNLSINLMSKDTSITKQLDKVCKVYVYTGPPPLLPSTQQFIH